MARIAANEKMEMNSHNIWHARTKFEECQEWSSKFAMSFIRWLPCICFFASNLVNQPSPNI
jgi:hypothetical protein